MKRKRRKNHNPSEPDLEATRNQLSKYLNTWKNERNEWKFEKVKQMRLVAGMLDVNKVPDDVFTIFVEYMTYSQGKIKEIVTGKAKQVIKDMEKFVNADEEERMKIIKPDSKSYKRARELIQSLN